MAHQHCRSHLLITALSQGFISKSWQVTSTGAFVGLCVGVVLLVMSLELLRRLQREYDAWCLRRDQEAFIAIPSGLTLRPSPASEAGNGPKDAATASSNGADDVPQQQRLNRLTVIHRHIVRSLVHTAQFGVAYFVMLLAMYYNGTYNSSGSTTNLLYRVMTHDESFDRLHHHLHTHRGLSGCTHFQLGPGSDRVRFDAPVATWKLLTVTHRSNIRQEQSDTTGCCG